MKSITIHNLESDLAIEIERQSKQKGISQNRFIKEVLRRALEMDEAAIHRRKNYYAKIFGTMSAREAEEFYGSIDDVSEIDPTQW